MKPFEEQLNEVIVDTYRSILRVEENILKRSDQTDLSISEIHMLEAVGKGKDRRRTISELAEVLNITLPSVTVAINKLMKKRLCGKGPWRRGWQNRVCFFNSPGKANRFCTPLFP